MESLHPLGSLSPSPAAMVSARNYRRYLSKEAAGSSKKPDGVPALRRRQLFSALERAFYEILCCLAPRHTVFAKVRLAELVERHSAESELSSECIDRKHVDFVLCDENLNPVVAIELDDVHNQNSSGRDRDVDEVLAAAALPVIHVPAGRRHAMDEVHQLLLPYLRIGTSTI